MIRKIMLLFTALFALHSGLAHGLGLGALKLKSSLNQEFEAEIEITNTRGLGIDEILPNLASLADFKRVGVERSYILTDLRFKIQADGEGNFVVVITSRRPIIEPYLNFIVEILWPSGRILREYTVLLDPPVFSEEGIEPIRVGRTQTTTPREPAATRPGARTPTPSRAKPQVDEPGDREAIRQVGDIADQDYGVTGPGDTLWAIALKVRPDSSVTVQQTMLAIQKYNPKAFINNNINLLMAGYVLRIPTFSEIDEVSSSRAIREVQNQNESWEIYKGEQTSIAQLDASSRRAEQREPAPVPEGELKLVAADSSQGERAGSGSDTARVGELENDLSIALEDLDRAQRANTELNVKLDDLSGQVETLTRLVQLKDDQFAALQAQLNQLQSLADAEAEPQPPASSASVLSNPFVLGGIGVLLVAGVAGGLVFVRRRQQVESLEEEGIAAISPEREDTTIGIEQDDVEDLDTLLPAEDEDVSSQTSDVLGEVDIYIAYGRFPQAINFLQNAIESEPERTDVRIKLLEVLVQTEDTSAFNLQLEKLKSLGDEDATQQALAMQAKFAGAEEEAEAAMGATVVSSEPIVAISESDGGEEDFDLDLDDLDEELDLDSEDAEELDLDIELDEEDEDATELDLDLDLDLDEEELDLDLDLDEEEGADAAEEDSTVSLSTPIEQPVSGDDDLELDLDDGDLDLDLDDDGDLDLDLDDDGDDLDLDLDLGDDEEESELSLDDDDGLDLGDEEEESELSLDDDDGLDLDLGDEEEESELSLDDDDGLDLGDDEEESELSLTDDDDLELVLEDDAALSLEDDDDFALDLADEGDDAELSLQDDDSLDLNLDEELELESESLELNDSQKDSFDDAATVVLEGAQEDGLDLGEDDLDLSLDDDDELDLSLDDDDALDLSLDDDELDLGLEENNKLDLARAYIDMGDADGAKNLLAEVLKEGSDSEQREATELLERID